MDSDHLDQYPGRDGQLQNTQQQVSIEMRCFSSEPILL
jgi:hypothetical protein